MQRELPLTGPAPRSRSLSESQRLAWLRLLRSENVGPVTFRELVNHFGGAEAALEALPELARRGGRRRPARICSRADAEREIAAARRAGARLVASAEPGYPPLLAGIYGAPPLLYVKGDTGLVARPCVAIVGARNGSAIGQKLTRQFATALGMQDIVIVSGLARGIDGAAHRAALERGTMAVLAGGIDVAYPPEHAGLQEEIARQGLLVTESPPGLAPRGRDFPRRNRIISGVSLAVVVVEAARRSGSLITARLAAEQGREVMAVPGHPLDPRASGPNRLLKDGATMVTRPEDILKALRGVLGKPAMAGTSGDGAAKAMAETGGDGQEGDAPAGPDPLGDPVPDLTASDRSRVLAALGPTPVDIDEIARATGLDIRAVRVALLELDLAGRLARHGAACVSLADAD